MEVTRRTVLKALGATAAGAVAAETLLGVGEADAAVVRPTVQGAIQIPDFRNWYKTKTVLKPNGKPLYIDGKKQTYRVQTTRKIYSDASNWALDRGMGFGPTLERPGDSGHVIIFGHRTTHGGPMRWAHTMKPILESRFPTSLLTKQLGKTLASATPTEILAGSYDPVTKQMVNAFVYRVERLDLWTVKNSKGKKMNYDKLLNYPEELTGATAGGLSIITCTQTNGKPTSVKNRLIVRAYLVGPYTPPS